jgi:hypothetical protein
MCPGGLRPRGGTAPLPADFGGFEKIAIIAGSLW